MLYVWSEFIFVVVVVVVVFVVVVVVVDRNEDPLDVQKS